MFIRPYKKQDRVNLKIRGLYLLWNAASSALHKFFGFFVVWKYKHTLVLYFSRYVSSYGSKATLNT